MAEYWLDYSASKLSGETIRNAVVGPNRERATGVVRYIDSPANLGRKHTNADEYRSHIAAGLKVALVMQTTTTASDGGYPAGQDHARRALAGANFLGYGGPIFFTNDRTTVPNAATWRAYLDGAASILGRARVGAYGFRDAMDLAVGHASYFWQAGRRSDVAAHTHLWQDNNTQVTVGGVLCDRNLVLRPITAMEDELNWNDLVTDPRTGQPALDYYGNRFDHNAQDFYTNRQVAQVTEHTSDRWYTEERQPDGAVRLVPAVPPTEEERRAGKVGNRKAARSLDTMDGNYLVGLIGQVASDVAALKEAQTAPVPVEIDYQRIIDGVAAKLGTLRFDVEPEETGTPTTPKER